jgi:hypothetical protein
VRLARDHEVAGGIVEQAGLRQHRRELVLVVRMRADEQDVLAAQPLGEVELQRAVAGDGLARKRGDADGKAAQERATAVGALRSHRFPPVSPDARRRCGKSRRRLETMT